MVISESRAQFRREFKALFAPKTKEAMLEMVSELHQRSPAPSQDLILTAMDRALGLGATTAEYEKAAGLS